MPSPAIERSSTSGHSATGDRLPEPWTATHYDRDGRETADREAALARSLTGPGPAVYAARRADGRLLDPCDQWSDAWSLKRRGVAPEWAAVSAEAFESYVRYLRTKDPIHLRHAARS